MYDKRKRKVIVYVTWESHWTILSTLSVQSDKNITSPPMSYAKSNRFSMMSRTAQGRDVFVKCTSPLLIIDIYVASLLPEQILFLFYS